MTDFCVTALVGVELEQEQFMRVGIEAPRWCSCPNKPDNVRFCPHCGAKKYGVREVRHWDHTLLPSSIRRAVEKRIDSLHDEDDEGDEDLGLIDALLDFRCPLDGDLSLISIPNCDRLFVGRLLDMRQRDDRRPMERFDLESMTDGLLEGLRSLGIGAQPQLHLIGSEW